MHVLFFSHIHDKKNPVKPVNIIRQKHTVIL